MTDDRFADYTAAHWSCLFYVEGRVVGRGGVVPIFGPDIMSDPEWNAAVDLIRDGLLSGSGSPADSFVLTDDGWDAAHALRRLRATGEETDSESTRSWVLAQLGARARGPVLTVIHSNP